MSRAFKAEIIENRPLSRDVKLITILPTIPVMNPEPGQFYMVQSGKTYDPLLKRPFCVFDADSYKISFLIRMKGRGTSLLVTKEKGSLIDVIGPLGMPYPLIDKRPLIIMGGMGIASLFSLIKRYGKDAAVLYGARNRDEIFFQDIIESSVQDLFISTDDGSAGKKGIVVDFMPEYLDSPDNMVVFSCGPDAMLKRVSELCLERRVECYVSLEQNMACGFGSCLGCVVTTRNGNKRVCKEGPVFSADEVVWG